MGCKRPPIQIGSFRIPAEPRSWGEGYGVGNGSMKTLQTVGEDEDRPTFCTSGNPAGGANRRVV